MHGSDLGALLSASTLIKFEDRKENIELYKKLRQKFHIGYFHRGSMIYNLFRSEILKFEVLNHLNKLKMMYRNKPDEIKVHFLLYWDSIINEGYPTAYFVSGLETKQMFQDEITKRLNKGAKFVRVYSRTENRNKNTAEWCREFAKENKCLCVKLKKYQLGFTPAFKVKISKE